MTVARDAAIQTRDEDERDLQKMHKSLQRIRKAWHLSDSLNRGPVQDLGHQCPGL